MSLLHLLGCDDDLSFDGKGLDKTVDSIKSYANSKFNEDEVDRANDTLSDILSYAESIDTLENISNNVDCLVDATNSILHSSIASYKILKNISEVASDYCEVGNEQHIQDLLHCLAEDAEEAMSHLNQELSIEIDIEDMFTDKFIPYIDFDFIPDTAILNRSDRSGLVCYVSGDWEFTLSTYVCYGGLRMTPKTIQYKHLDFMKGYDKIVEIGLDPQKITVEDVQLLKIVDSQNKLIYNLFIK